MTDDYTATVVEFTKSQVIAAIPGTFFVHVQSEDLDEDINPTIEGVSKHLAHFIQNSYSIIEVDFNDRIDDMVCHYTFYTVSESTLSMSPDVSEVDVEKLGFSYEVRESWDNGVQVGCGNGAASLFETSGPSEGQLVLTSRPGWRGYFLVAAPIMTCQTSHL
ncbi:hypothetical protein QJS10_CPB21g01094 [Acorus calamus]|uniref:Uncharacterized protein n=1 Tax=Acorus calamus TaxID=4465 RepID=A0AAV9C4E7_ACOCL|nr:hypothetical protein QJS10_CPB21g01094 [Acorus calamus]